MYKLFVSNLVPQNNAEWLGAGLFAILVAFFAINLAGLSAYFGVIPGISVLAFWATWPALAVAMILMSCFGPKGSKEPKRVPLGMLPNPIRQLSHLGADGSAKAAAWLIAMLAIVFLYRAALVPFGEFFMSSLRTLL